ncbi:MAG: RNA polymerase sigma factor [Planctomycetota bacterium]|nr:MAG: RNA polymerase sigma factor [Planctomycetota bacterium]REJ93699.1 MAG: RNA polymerase sigma factor [Planctomycetota bacterium]REK25747.1 MAG: RNA polymerase sigma factor [Planctomycetota bacterium]REK46506.1 MAG: RNA polymerase sigma factor [Planctomycetota bacterium]
MSLGTSSSRDLDGRPEDGSDADASRESDESLLARYCSNGEMDAYEQLVQRYEREVYSYLRRFLGNAEMAEDAFQGTFLQVHLKCAQFQSGRRFRPWLYSIATNQAIDLQRRNKRHRAVSLDSGRQADDDDLASLVDLLENAEPGPVAQLEVSERREWIRKAVAALPETLRSAVTLVYYQSLKYREAAEALGVPVGTVKSRLHSALLKLNQAWRDSETEPSQ